MMTEGSDKKKLAAAMAAVTAYLHQEQEAMGMQPAAAEVPAVAVRLWGVSGRQAQMANRQLMQMRVFSR